MLSEQFKTLVQEYRLMLGGSLVQKPHTNTIGNGIL